MTERNNPCATSPRTDSSHPRQVRAHPASTRTSTYGSHVKEGGVAPQTSLASLLVLILVAACAPSAPDEVKDRLIFSGGEKTHVRHVRVETSGGSSSVRVTADVPIYTGAVDGQRPVTLTVVPAGSSESVLDDLDPGYVAGTESSVAGQFDVIECPAGETCNEDFTITFTRVLGDPEQSLEFDWSVRLTAQYEGREFGASPLPGAYLEVKIGP